jgi:hypothetical protein
VKRHKIRFYFSLLIFISLNLACTSSRTNSSQASNNGQLPNSPFGADPFASPGTTDPFATDDLFLPGFDDAPPKPESKASASGSECTPSAFGGLGVGYPEGYGGSNSIAGLECVDDQDQAMQMLLLQSLNSFEHMGQCFQAGVAQIKGYSNMGKTSSSGSDPEFDQLGVVRCYRDLSNKNNFAAARAFQAQQQQHAGDQQYYFLIQQLLASLNKK